MLSDVTIMQGFVTETIAITEAGELCQQVRILLSHNISSLGVSRNCGRIFRWSQDPSGSWVFKIRWNSIRGRGGSICLMARGWRGFGTGGTRRCRIRRRFFTFVISVKRYAQGKKHKQGDPAP